jgi:hypothetical protein
MAPETGPKPEAERLRDGLLGQWEPRRTPYLVYRKEIETMLANQEKQLMRERRLTAVIWIYFVLLATVLLTGSGVLMIHRIEGTWMAVSAVAWLVMGSVFLFGHLINKTRVEVIKEIKGVELRLAALEERLTGRGDVAGPSD